MNRQTKRMLQRQGQPSGAARRGAAPRGGVGTGELDPLDAAATAGAETLGTPAGRAGGRRLSPFSVEAGRRVTVPQAPSQRTTPARFFREVRNELRQVAWPTRVELVNYTMVVLTVLVIMIALIFALNYGFSKAVLFLFQK